MEKLTIKKRKSTQPMGLVISLPPKISRSRNEVFRSHSYDDTSALLERDFITVICNCLAVSGYQAASDYSKLKKNKITHIINTVGHKYPNCFPQDFIYKQFVLKDQGTQSIQYAIEESINFIDKVESIGGRVLIHCEQGKSRSPTVVAAYLMIRLGLDENQAIDFLQQKRPQVDPNLGFMLQLGQLKNPKGNIFTIREEVDESLPVVKCCDFQDFQEKECFGIVAIQNDKILI